MPGYARYKELETPHLSPIHRQGHRDVFIPPRHPPGHPLQEGLPGEVGTGQEAPEALDPVDEVGRAGETTGQLTYGGPAPKTMTFRFPC